MTDVNSVMKITNAGMVKAIDRLEEDLAKIRAGKANPTMLDSVAVDYYGTMTPLNQVANITASDAKTLTIQPWEKSMLHPIATAIVNSNLGYNPQNNGEMILITLPALTEERRKEFVKKARMEAESAKVMIRNIRKEANEGIRKLQKDGLSEDEIKVAETKIQKLTDEFVSKADATADAKEREIMKV